MLLVGGLLIGNTALALTASRGLLRASSSFRVYATVSTLLALGSITLGVESVAVPEVLFQPDLFRGALHKAQPLHEMVIAALRQVPRSK